MIGAIKPTRNSIKRNFIYKGCDITFGGFGLWRFSTGLGKNLVIFGVEFSVVRIHENFNINPLMLGDETIMTLIAIIYINYLY